MQFKRKALALLGAAVMVAAAGYDQSADKKDAGAADKSPNELLYPQQQSMQAAMNELKDNYVKAHHLDASWCYYLWWIDASRLNRAPSSYFRVR